MYTYALPHFQSGSHSVCQLHVHLCSSTLPVWQSLSVSTTCILMLFHISTLTITQCVNYMYTYALPHFQSGSHSVCRLHTLMLFHTSSLAVTQCVKYMHTYALPHFERGSHSACELHAYLCSSILPVWQPLSM